MGRKVDHPRGISEQLYILYNKKRILQVENQKNIEECYGKDCLSCKSECEFRDCGVNVIAEKQEELSRLNNRKHNYIDEIMNENISYELPNDFIDFIDCDDLEESERDKIIRLTSEALRRLYWMLKEKPQTTIDLLRSVFENKKQIEFAKERNQTRQAVSKRHKGDVSAIGALLGMRDTRSNKDGSLRNLTPMEFQVYKLKFVDGCTIKSVAMQTGVSERSIVRLAQSIRSKLAKNGAHKKRKSKNIEKIISEKLTD